MSKGPSFLVEIERSSRCTCFECCGLLKKIVDCQFHEDKSKTHTHTNLLMTDDAFHNIGCGQDIPAIDTLEDANLFGVFIRILTIDILLNGCVTVHNSFHLVKSETCLRLKNKILWV